MEGKPLPPRTLEVMARLEQYTPTVSMRQPPKQHSSTCNSSTVVSHICLLLVRSLRSSCSTACGATETIVMTHSSKWSGEGSQHWQSARHSHKWSSCR